MNRVKFKVLTKESNQFKSEFLHREPKVINKGFCDIDNIDYTIIEITVIDYSDCFNLGRRFEQLKHTEFLLKQLKAHKL